MDGITTLVLADQVTAVDGETRIGEFVGRLSAEELAEVDRALKLVLGLR
jgi:mRNA interferase MazF